MNIQDFIHSDPAIKNGQLVFRGTDVLVEALLLHIEQERAIDEFVEDNPSVSMEQVKGVINFAHALIERKKQ
ncbi:DUF433 domain-containing protein [Cytophagales bacterium LB-30]|uniref:DUF433 domain-containing protein n=1 Tax=Shiella aurantiaca TaxID=3058365 RepID=A0ABT8F7X8_9BACT|nr:DUF433 domain-containing protein [Shiella aurantiaca]MDN4166490.1 DUF433 domain-containing protein [Shiella aurantiaca]